jgi:single-stranded-DNA-specific exonuclease
VIKIKTKGAKTMSRKKWLTAHIDKELAAQVAENHSLDPFTALILVSRGITEYEDVEEFFDCDFSFCDPYLIADMEKAVERIEKAINEKEKICVYGDYDADGVTATALMYSYLSSQNADVMYYIPDRISEGYGMNCNAITSLHEKGVKLIVTVDNGISAIEEIKYANSLGIETVVTDHHQVGEVLPDAVAVIDPHREDCNLNVGIRRFEGAHSMGQHRNIAQRREAHQKDMFTACWHTIRG